MLYFQPFNELYYIIFLTHLIKFLDGTLSMTIGINLWLAPQISEHWPKKTPGRLEKKLIWLSRPGTASALIPILGIVHEWRTSAAEISVRIWEFIGTTVRLSTSRRRINDFSPSLDGIMYESNSILLKSEYSYDQYHWCPIVLIVIAGLKTSSRRYRIRIDGRPIKIKINLGIIVQNSSSPWDSNMCWSILVLKIVENKLNPTIVIIKIKIVRVWSWKKINCSIKGDDAFWKPKAAHVAIFKGKIHL